MARQPRQRSICNLKSTGWELARFTGRTLDKTATGLFRWLTTDHSGMTRMLTLMPEMGLLDSVKYVFMCLLITIAGIVLQIVWLYFLIFHCLPLLLSIWHYRFMVRLGLPIDLIRKKGSGGNLWIARSLSDLANRHHNNSTRLMKRAI